MNNVSAVYQFKPVNVARWIIWSLFALILIAAPYYFKSNFGIAVLTQIGTVMVMGIHFGQRGSVQAFQVGWAITLQNHGHMC
jgi:hypothetical protein